MLRNFWVVDRQKSLVYSWIQLIIMLLMIYWVILSKRRQKNFSMSLHHLNLRRLKFKDHLLQIDLQLLPLKGLITFLSLNQGNRSPKIPTKQNEGKPKKTKKRNHRKIKIMSKVKKSLGLRKIKKIMHIRLSPIPYKSALQLKKLRLKFRNACKEAWFREIRQILQNLTLWEITFSKTSLFKLLLSLIKWQEIQIQILDAVVHPL